MVEARKKQGRKLKLVLDSEFKTKMKVLTAVLGGLMTFGGLAGSTAGVTRDYERVIYTGMALTAVGLCVLGRGIAKEIDEEAERIENDRRIRAAYQGSENEKRIRSAVIQTEIENELDRRPKVCANFDCYFIAKS